MLVPILPSALSQAYQVICLQAVRAIARRQQLRREEFAFALVLSLKCKYCTKQAEKCCYMLVYARTEYNAFQVAFVAQEEAEVEEGLGEREKEAAEAVLRCVEEELY